MILPRNAQQNRTTTPYYSDYVGFARWYYRRRQFTLYQIVWPTMTASTPGAPAPRKHSRNGNRCSASRRRGPVYLNTHPDEQERVEREAIVRAAVKPLRYAARAPRKPGVTFHGHPSNACIGPLAAAGKTFSAPAIPLRPESRWFANPGKPRWAHAPIELRYPCFAQTQGGRQWPPVNACVDPCFSRPGPRPRVPPSGAAQ